MYGQCYHRAARLYHFNFYQLSITNFIWEFSKIVRRIFSFCLKWEDDANVIEMITLTIAIFWSVGLNFLICEPGQWVTDQYEMCSDELYECNRYSLSVKMQRMYMVFFVDTQQSIDIQRYFFHGRLRIKISETVSSVPIFEYIFF